MQALQYGVDLQNGELDALGLPLFRPLSTYSWEQSDGLVKIYVPLRGVQTDLLRCATPVPGPPGRLEAWRADPRVPVPLSRLGHCMSLPRLDPGLICQLHACSRLG